MKNNDLDVIDLFDKELNKKEKKLEKKINKAKLKEEKNNKKRLKKLEIDEEIGFNEYLEKMKEKTILESPKEVNQIDFNIIKEKEAKNIEFKDNNEHLEIFNIEKEKKHPILNFFLGLFSCFLLIISTDYLFYNCVKKYVDLSTMLNSIILVSTVFFFLLSNILKKESSKKFFQIITTICFSLFMLYYLINS